MLKKNAQATIANLKKHIYDQAQGHDQGLSCVIKYPM